MTRRVTVLVTLVVLGTLVTAPVAAVGVVGASTASPADDVDVQQAGTDDPSAGAATQSPSRSAADRARPEVWNSSRDIADYEHLTSIVSTDDGGFAYVGMARENLSEGFFITLSRTGPNGTVQWTRRYDTLASGSVTSLIQTDDGGFVVAGEGSREDLWMLKVGPNGTVEWNNTIDTLDYPSMVDLVQTDDGGFALLYNSDWGDGPARLVTTGPEGDREWNHTFGADSVASALTQADDGSYAVAGSTGNRSESQIWLAKTGPNAVETWQRTLGPGSANDVVRADIDGVGGFALVGQNASTGDAFLIGADDDGYLQWRKSYGGTDEDAAQKLLRADDGGYAILGESFGSIGNVRGTYYWLLRTESDGDRDWRRAWNASPGAPGYALDDVAETPNGEFALVGTVGGGDEFNSLFSRTYHRSTRDAIEVSIAGTTSPVTEGDPLTVAVTVENEDDLPYSLWVNLSVGSENVYEEVNLSAGETRTVNVTWQTEPGDAGTYDVSASAYFDSSDTVEVTVEPVGDDCDGTDPADYTNTTRFGHLFDSGDGDTVNFSVDPDAEKVRLSLSGPDEADFDLYATTDGRTPTTDDYDARSWSLGSAETIELDGEELGTSLGVLVDSYSGDGNYSLEVAELHRSGDCDSEPRTERGYLRGSGDGDTYRFGANATSEQFVVELNGTPPADFDLYATLDGREPTTSDYDLRSWSFDSQERIVVDADRIDGVAAVRVDSYQGAGNYTLTIRPRTANGSATGTGDWVEGCVPVFGACSADGS